MAKDGDWDDGSVGEGQEWVGHYSIHINMPPQHANPSTPAIYYMPKIVSKLAGIASLT